MQYPDILNFYNSTIKKHYSKASAALHDPLAVAVVLDRALVETSLMYVDVETHSDLTRGETVGDVWGVTGKTPNV
ncbi:MAG TPA: pyrimidine-specific ribonucleoside hydrolase RihA, partial [Firmicutes bacterium]|nr:pyrimidine-specific ribonucleoside hydrolase RihA [Bacillota bacterium]